MDWLESFMSATWGLWFDIDKRITSISVHISFLCPISWIPRGPDYGQEEGCLLWKPEWETELVISVAGEGRSACPTVTVCGTNAINESNHVPGCQSTIRSKAACLWDFTAPLGILTILHLDLSFVLALFCWILLSLLHSVTLFPHCSHLVLLSRETFLPASPLSSISSYLLLFLTPVSLSPSQLLESDECGWRNEEWRCNYCTLLFRMCVLGEK